MKNPNPNKKYENKKYVSTYFEAELFKLAEEMSYEEMVDQLKNLEDTRYWVAITKYVQSRLITAQASLCALDPIKETVSICRGQGIISGLLDLQSMITVTKETINQAVKKENEKNSETPEMDMGVAQGEGFVGY